MPGSTLGYPILPDAASCRSEIPLLLYVLQNTSGQVPLSECVVPLRNSTTCAFAELQPLA